MRAAFIKDTLWVIVPLEVAMLFAQWPVLTLAAMAGAVSMATLPALARAAQPPSVTTKRACANPTAGQWWLDLSLPPATRAEPAQRTAQTQKIKQQQEEVTRAVEAAGARVVGSVSLVRNALAVQATPEQISALRKLPQVRSARPMVERYRTGSAPLSAAPCD
jgi:hypothetical protein